MRVLSMHQPWASLVADRGQDRRDEKLAAAGGCGR